MARRTRSKSTVSAHRPESSEPTRRVAVHTKWSTDGASAVLDRGATPSAGHPHHLPTRLDQGRLVQRQRLRQGHPPPRPARRAGRCTLGRIDVLWHAHLCRAVDVAAALAGYLAEDLGCKPAMICPTGRGPGSRSASMSDLVDTGHLSPLPGAVILENFLGFMIADPDGKSTVIGRVRDLLRRLFRSHFASQQETTDAGGHPRSPRRAQTTGT